jgi:hypothetical protein
LTIIYGAEGSFSRGKKQKALDRKKKAVYITCERCFFSIPENINHKGVPDHVPEKISDPSFALCRILFSARCPRHFKMDKRSLKAVAFDAGVRSGSGGAGK